MCPELPSGRIAIRLNRTQSMATIHYIAPYNKITGKGCEDIHGETLRLICEQINAKYPEFDPLIIDGGLTKKLVILVNRRSALTMDGLDTPVDESSEIIIMRYLGWA
jgi:molybdopterin converting factor small subunit